MTATTHQTENMLFFNLLHLIVVIGAARIMSTLLCRAGQPGVIVEIVAGLLLGALLSGHSFPDASILLFGRSAATPITIISQIGLILLMFRIGTDFVFGHLRGRRNRRGVLLVAGISVAVPLALGVVAISAAAINDVIGWVPLAGLSAYAAFGFSPDHPRWRGDPNASGLITLVGAPAT